MTIIVAPLHEVRSVLAARRPSHLVTLGSPDGPTAEVRHAGPRLRLLFHDVAAARDGLTPATAGDIERLLAFARGWDAGQPLLIHCWAGVSRSPAAAYAIACARAQAGEEARLAAALRAAAPFATPNPLVVALADGLLGRDGAMIEAISAIGRGAEIGLGSSFELRAGDAAP